MILEPLAGAPPQLYPNHGILCILNDSGADGATPQHCPNQEMHRILSSPYHTALPKPGYAWNSIHTNGYP